MFSSHSLHVLGEKIRNLPISLISKKITPLKDKKKASCTVMINRLESNSFFFEQLKIIIIKSKVQVTSYSTYQAKMLQEHI